MVIGKRLWLQHIIVLSQEKALPFLPTLPQYSQTKGENYATSTHERSLVIKKSNKMFLKMMRNIEMKYTVPFICLQDHFAEQALLSFNDLGQ